MGLARPEFPLILLGACRSRADHFPRFPCLRSPRKIPRGEEFSGAVPREALPEWGQVYVPHQRQRGARVRGFVGWVPLVGRMGPRGWPGAFRGKKGKLHFWQTHICLVGQRTCLDVHPCQQVDYDYGYSWGWSFDKHGYSLRT